jgi:REP element-mobilizing transposase RayT
MKNKNCKLHNINGVADHIHILCDLHPSIALVDLVKDIKVATSIWMKASGNFLISRDGPKDMGHSPILLETGP